MTCLPPAPGRIGLGLSVGGPVAHAERQSPDPACTSQNIHATAVWRGVTQACRAVWSQNRCWRPWLPTLLDRSLARLVRPAATPSAVLLRPQRWPALAAGSGGAPLPELPAEAAAPTLLLVDRRDPALGRAWRHQLLQTLQPAELERLQRFRLPQDADRFLLGRGLLRRWLAQLLGCSATDFSFSLLAHGKPVLLGAPHFNLSHSGDLILLGLHRHRSVGVDLERDRARFDWQPIARRYFSEAVRQRLEHDHPDETLQRQAFLLEWCRLEARLKADGCGLSGLDGRGEGLWTADCWQVSLPQGYWGAAALLPSDGVALGRAEASTAAGGIHMASP